MHQKVFTYPVSFDMAYVHAYSQDIIQLESVIDSNDVKNEQWFRIDNGVYITYVDDQGKYQVTNLSTTVPKKLCPSDGIRMKDWYSELHSTGICNSWNIGKTTNPEFAAVVKGATMYSFIPARHIFTSPSPIPFIFAKDKYLKDYGDIDYVYLYEQFVNRDCVPGKYFISKADQTTYDIMVVMPSSLSIIPTNAKKDKLDYSFEVSSTNETPIVVYQSMYLKTPSYTSKMNISYDSFGVDVLI